MGIGPKQLGNSARTDYERSSMSKLPCRHAQRGPARRTFFLPIFLKLVLQVSAGPVGSLEGIRTTDPAIPQSFCRRDTKPRAPAVFRFQGYEVDAYRWRGHTCLEL